MRRKLKRAVLKKFSEGISVLCPGFELFMKKNNLLYWNLKIGEEFLFSIMIWPNRRHDVFTIDLKWSDDEINWFSSPRHLESWRRRGRGGLGYLTMRKPGFVPNFDLDPELTAARRDDVLEEFAKWPAPTDVDIALARVTDKFIDRALEFARQRREDPKWLPAKPRLRV